jgi:hypothetical protein
MEVWILIVVSVALSGPIYWLICRRNSDVRHRKASLSDCYQGPML